MDDKIDEGRMFLSSAGEIERFLSDRAPSHTAVRSLLSPRGVQGLDLTKPVRAGMRVAFVESTRSLLVYPFAPGAGVAGTVVRVRTSSGDSTVHGGMVHVRWDNGTFQSVYLQDVAPAPRQLSAGKWRVTARCPDKATLLGHFRVASNGDLIHKSSQDLWSLREAGGGFVIERLFDLSGNPLKEGA